MTNSTGTLQINNFYDLNKKYPETENYDAFFNSTETINSEKVKSIIYGISLVASTNSDYISDKYSMNNFLDLNQICEANKEEIDFFYSIRKKSFKKINIIKK